MGGFNILILSGNKRYVHNSAVERCRFTYDVLVPPVMKGLIKLMFRAIFLAQRETIKIKRLVARN